MLTNYFPILVFGAIVLLMGTFLIALWLILGKVMGHAKPDKAKQSPYECGFDAFEDARMKFDVRYYLVAILFIICMLVLTTGLLFFLTEIFISPTPPL